MCTGRFLCIICAQISDSGTMHGGFHSPSIGIVAKVLALVRLYCALINVQTGLPASQLVAITAAATVTTIRVGTIVVTITLATVGCTFINVGACLGPVGEGFAVISHCSLKFPVVPSYMGYLWH